MKRQLLIAMSLLLMLGCGQSKQQATVEVSTDPKVLLDEKTPAESISVFGVKLGDVGASIPNVKADAYIKEILVRADDKAEYRVGSDGKVLELRVFDPVLLNQLGINRPNDFIVRFGKADSEDTGKLGSNYVWKNARRAVHFNDEGKLAGISVL
jgi:hypothetical protein